VEERSGYSLSTSTTESVFGRFASFVVFRAATGETAVPTEII
jgi:hypothetical protein